MHGDIALNDFLALQETLVGRYALERELGRGGMGTVWLARDIRLERLVAIKVLHPQLATDPAARARFITEARLAARLAHPNVVPVFAVEADHEQPLIVMALIDGESVAERLANRGAMAVGQVDRLLREMGWALGYAHAAGVIHRDITPANILLEADTGRALLADFGLATVTEHLDATPVFGTPGHVAPEVIRGEPAGPASDIYALGVVAYTLLAGRPPFIAESTGELLARHLVGTPPALAPLAPGAPRRLLELVESCLAKDPADRPADADALLSRLARAPESITIAPPLATWFSRWSRFRPIYAIAAPVLGLQSWLLVWGYFGSGQTSFLIAALLSTIVSLTAIPIAAHLVAEAVALRRLRHHGFDIADIRSAWPHWTEHLERLRARDGLRPLAGRVIFDLTVVGTAALVATFAIVIPFLPAWIDAAEVSSVQGALMSMASTVYLGVMIGVGIGFISPGIRLAPGGRIRRLMRRLWDTRLAGTVTWLAGLGQHARLAASGTLHRNTELVLGLAIEEVWHGLPRGLQLEIGTDLPEVASTLRHGAESLRDLVLQMREAESALAADDPELAALVAERERVETHQRESVATLERIRLQLLRLASERRGTEQLTGHLKRARELERDLLAEVAAHDDIRRFLRGDTARAASPFPTPASA